jgi:hypothetical protein
LARRAERSPHRKPKTDAQNADPANRAAADQVRRRDHGAERAGSLVEYDLKRPTTVTFIAHISASSTPAVPDGCMLVVPFAARPERAR